MKCKLAKTCCLTLIILTLVFNSLFTNILEANQKKNLMLNKETDNLNVLFVGVDGKKLKMISLYTIDYQETWRSAAIFFPTKTVVINNTTEAISLQDVYEQAGTKGVVDLLENKLAVSISYHIKVERGILTKISAIIDPIYVAGQPVDIANLFDMKITPDDDYILGELVKEFSKPAVFFFSLPELFFSFRKHISTDFAITPSNLYLHYKIATGIKPSLLKKTILTGQDYYDRGKWVQVVPEDTWERIVYQLTKK